MRTKALLLAAALSAAGIATSMAQVYSVNAVGYVNISVPANGIAIVANPLNGTNNSVNTILPLPDGSDGVTIFRWDPNAMTYLDSITFITGLGWLSASDPNPTIDPGEGFWLQNPLATALNITFVGEVPQGTSLVNPIPGGNHLALKGSIVPQALRLGDTNTPGTLNFPADDGDTVYVFDATTQNYKDSYTYIAGLGWLSASDPDTNGPLIQVGQGFWTWKQGVAKDWTRNFTVN